MFIKVNILQADGKECPTLVDLQYIEQFRIIDGKVFIYYINKDENGSNWMDELLDSPKEIADYISQIGQLIKPIQK